MRTILNFIYYYLQFSGFNVEFLSLEQVKTHLRTSHLVTEETCHLSSIILPAKHLIPAHQVHQFARDEDEDDDDEVCVLEEIPPPRFPSEAKDEEEEEVEVLEEIPPPSFRRKQKARDDWRVALLNKMREMRFLPPDQLAFHLRKAKEEMKKKRTEEEEVRKSLRKVMKEKESRKEEE